MNIDLLVKMANEISAFFAAESDQEQAARNVMSHLKRYWAPRMRTQMVQYYQERKGAGLTDLALRSVELLAAESAAPTASVPPGPINQ
jgi:formate dehydrogenase subunit delta